MRQKATKTNRYNTKDSGEKVKNGAIAPIALNAASLSLLRG
jgi:hypothetical protein